MNIDLKFALNFSVVSPKAKNIGWWNAIELVGTLSLVKEELT